MYDSVHNLNKYSVPNLNKIPSVNSKFDTLNNFYKDFQGVKNQTEERKQKKITVLKKSVIALWLVD